MTSQLAGPARRSEEMSEEWEYKVLWPDPKRTLTGQLNSAARDGWRLVEKVMASEEIALIFERKREGPIDD